VLFAGPFVAAAIGCAAGSTIDPDLDGANTTKQPTEPATTASLPPTASPDNSTPPPEESTGDAGTPSDGGSKSDGGGGGGGGGTTTKAAPGDVVISEIMYDCGGTEPLCEWLEIKNLTTAPKSLSGLTLEDSGGRTHVIGSGVVVPANAYRVLVRNTNGANTAGVPGASVIYAYGDGLTPTTGVLLGNSGGNSITLRDGTTNLASITYGGWYSTSAQSIQLSVIGVTQQSSKGNWCISPSTWGTGADKGTPGAGPDC
jgi:hypothetical protein